ncbi:MAG: hypothetical protein ACPGJS_23985, partial [Flammeovirgaceae bacterium]
LRQMGNLTKKEYWIDEFGMKWNIDEGQKLKIWMNNIPLTPEEIEDSKRKVSKINHQIKALIEKVNSLQEVKAVLEKKIAKEAFIIDNTGHLLKRAPANADPNSGLHGQNAGVIFLRMLGEINKSKLQRKLNRKNEEIKEAEKNIKELEDKRNWY